MKKLMTNTPWPAITKIHFEVKAQKLGYIQFQKGQNKISFYGYDPLVFRDKPAPISRKNMYLNDHNSLGKVDLLSYQSFYQ